MSTKKSMQTSTMQTETNNILEQQESFDFGPARPDVRLARDGERKSVLEVLGRAFHDDPVTAYLFPKEKKRAEKWARLFGIAIDSMSDAAHVLTSDAVEGAAIWQFPEESKMGPLLGFRVALRFLAIAGMAAPRAIRLGDFMSTHHPSEPHYYLAALGTDPSCQGRGIGSALIQPVLDRCDKERMPAYLESSKERNVPFYQKHGFEVVEELEIPGGPTVWSMMRRTR